jgi:hypothetical protein
MKHGRGNQSFRESIFQSERTHKNIEYETIDKHCKITYHGKQQAFNDTCVTHKFNTNRENIIWFICL